MVRPGKAKDADDSRRARGRFRRREDAERLVPNDPTDAESDEPRVVYAARPAKPPRPLGPIEDYALGLLQNREHSRRELESKLARRGYPEAEVMALVARFVELNYVNDRRFAMAMAREGLARRGRGPRDTALRLRRAGIAAETAAAAQAEAEGEIDPKAALLALAQKKIALLKREESGKRRNKLARFLITRGFDPQAVREVVDRLIRDEWSEPFKENDDDDVGA